MGHVAKSASEIAKKGKDMGARNIATSPIQSELMVSVLMQGT